MIGEVIKIGFNGTAVTSGIKRINKAFGGMARGVGRIGRQVGIGGLRQVGATLTGLATRALGAIPARLDELNDMNRSLDVMSASTGVAKKEALALGYAIQQVTGRDQGEALDFLGDVSERLGEAFSDFDSTPAKALQELGILRKDLRGKNISEQLEMIAEAYTQLEQTKGTEKAMFTINELLGEVGKQMVPLFKTFGKAMEAARGDTADLARELEKASGELMAMERVKIAFSSKFSEFSLALLRNVTGQLGSLQDVADYIKKMDISSFVDMTAQGLSKILKGIKEQGIFQYLKTKLLELGEYLKQIISSAISEGLRDAMGNINPLGGLLGGKSQSKSPAFMNPIKGILGSTKDDNLGQEVAQNTERTNMLLERITNGVPAILT